MKSVLNELVDSFEHIQEFLNYMVAPCIVYELKLCLPLSGILLFLLYSSLSR